MPEHADLIGDLVIVLSHARRVCEIWFSSSQAMGLAMAELRTVVEHAEQNIAAAETAADPEVT